MELIAKLGLDWKLLLAQIVNFLILVVVLYKFAYKPVLGMLERRQQKIEQGLKDAAKSEELLKDIEMTRVAMLEKVKTQSLGMLEKAAAEAEIARQEILKNAAEEARKIQTKAEASIAAEKEKMLKEVGSEVVELAMLAAERILDREFSEADQKRVLAQLVSQAKHH